MRRMVLSLTVTAVALLMSASVAVAAAPIYCPSSGDCRGTSYDDVMYGPDTGTTMYGYGGNDYMFGYGGNDVLYGFGGKDWMYGGDGDDQLYGGDGNDYLYGDAGNDNYIGWHGNDRMYDRSYSSGAVDTYFGLRGGGNDVVVDYGGAFDFLDLTHLARSEVLITWLDTSDSDTNQDALRVEQKGVNNTVLVRNYFDNSGGLKRGTGAMEGIKFKDTTVWFPATEG